MMSYKQSFISLIAALCGLSLLPALLVLLVDPYHVYHRPLFERHAFEFDKDFFMIPGMIEHYLNDEAEGFDSVIVGTSLSTIYSAELMRKHLGWGRAMNLSVSGSNPQQHQVLLEKVLQVPHVKHLFIDIAYNAIYDDFYREGEPVNWSGNQLPHYLYNDSVFDDYLYVFDIYVFWDALMIALNASNRYQHSIDAPFDWHEMSEVKAIFERHATVEYLREYIRDLANTQPAVPLDEAKINELKFTTMDKGLLVPILPYCNKQLDIVINFSPRAPQYLARNAAEFYVRRYLVKRLAHCANIRIYATDQYQYITSNPANFMDNAHFTLAVSDVVLAKIAAGESRLTVDNIDDYEQKVLANIANQHAYLQQLLQERAPKN